MHSIQDSNIPPPSSPPPVRLEQGAFPSSYSGLSELTVIPHNRRSMLNNSLPGSTQELLTSFEERIAQLESSHTQISVELEASRDALFDERTKRLSYRHSIASSFDSDEAYPIARQPNIIYERKVRDELLASVQRLRSQNAALSKSLRESGAREEAATASLQKESTARVQIEEDSSRLSSANFILLEHNRLLASRDSALQSDVSALMAKSATDDMALIALKAQLTAYTLGGEHTQASVLASFPFTEMMLESTAELRSDLVAAQDQLHITERQLAASDQRCSTLSERIASLQHNITLCVDQSANALQVERELRSEVENRVQELLQENESLAQGKRVLETELNEIRPFADAWKRKVGELHQIEEMSKRASLDFANRRPLSEGSIQRAPESVAAGEFTFGMKHRESLLDHQMHNLACKRLTHRKHRISMIPARAVYTTCSTPINSATSDVSAHSPCSTAVNSPSPTRLQKRMSILATTLSRRSSVQSVQSALKANPSQFVDVTSIPNGPDAAMSDMEAGDAGAAYNGTTLVRRSSRMIKSCIRRASAIFVDLASAYSVAGVDEAFLNY